MPEKYLKGVFQRSKKYLEKTTKYWVTIWLQRRVSVLSASLCHILCWVFAKFPTLCNKTGKERNPFDPRCFW